ncbi:DUF427 domain-containing protein [Sphaerotilaceae bacterium SBD11-9]
MAKSPGHQKFPDHQVREQQVGQPMKVEVDGELIAASIDVIRVVEDRNPVRYYFPRADVAMAHLEPTSTTTSCPFKGEANYYTLKVGGKRYPDAVWSYENPYDEHRDLRGRLAFHDEKIPGLQITDTQASQT